MPVSRQMGGTRLTNHLVPSTISLLAHRLFCEAAICRSGDSHNSAVTATVFAGHDLLLTSDETGELFFWRVAPCYDADEEAVTFCTTKTESIRPGTEAITCIACRDEKSCRPSIFATGSDDATVQLFDFSSGARTQVLKTHKSCVTACDFSDVRPNLLASSSLDKAVHLWACGEADAPVYTIRSPSPCHSVHFLPEDFLLLCGTERGQILVWDIRNYATPVKVVPTATAMQRVWSSPSPARPKSPAFSSMFGGWCSPARVSYVPSMKVDDPFATLHDPNQDGRGVYNVSQASYVPNFVGHASNSVVHTAVPTNDGLFLVTAATADGVSCCKLWNLTTQQGMSTYAVPDSVLSSKPCLSRDNSQLLAGTADGRLHAWRTFDSPPIHDAKLGMATAAQFSTDGGHQYPVTSVAVDVQGTLIASGDRIGGVIVRSAALV